jgi:hypothetical protein
MTTQQEMVREAMQATSERRQGRYRLVYDKPTRTIIAVRNKASLRDRFIAFCRRARAALSRATGARR